MTEVRVRYAPSPTGHLHIGNARTALFNYLFARSQSGKMIIRIEDTDQKRNVEGGEHNQLRYLKWLGIDWDESIDQGGDYGPYKQSERLEIYQKYAQDLLDQGLAYRCYCTEEELEQERKEQIEAGQMPRYSGKHRHLSEEERKALEAEGRVPSIRFKVPEHRTYTFHDMVKGEVSFDSDGIGDFVIVKKDGMPTYNFAVAIDDYEMKITHVLRGDDHISNTPRQLMIFEAFGLKAPAYGHMTLIVNEERKKLSKRDESIIQFIEQYDQLGYLPEALFNFIAFLGWSPEGEEEIFSKKELIEIFDPARLSKSPAVFDTEKLAWLNNHYIRQLSLEQLVQLTLPHLQEAGYVPQSLSKEQLEWVTQVIGLYQEQMKYGKEITAIAALFFKNEIEYNEEAKQILTEEHVPEVIHAFIEKLKELPTFDAASIKKAIKSIQKETGHKGKRLFMPIRVVATGQVHGPDLTRSLSLLGKDKVLRRAEQVLTTIQ